MTVYVVQDTKTVDPKDGVLKPKFDFTPALEHGELSFLLSPNASPFNLPPVIEELHERLSDFNDEDFLLLVGSPVLLGLCVAIAADFNDGRVGMLQWSGAKRAYIPVRAEDIFVDCA
jgi:hypothetical protein